LDTCVPPRQSAQHGFDDCLGFGPGIECVGGQQEFEAPELPDPGDAAQRLARQHTFQHCRDPRLLHLVEPTFRMREDVRRRQP